jgi:hypothetical protein
MRAWIGIIGLAVRLRRLGGPEVAVTDLAYEARVEEYIHRFRPEQLTGERLQRQRSSNYSEYESRTSYIEQAELRKFSGDIKGEILKSGMFQLVQGTPYTADAKGDVYDVIKRIKAGISRAPTTCCSARCRTSTSPRTSTPWPHRQLLGGAGPDAGGGFQPDQYAHLRDHLGVHRHG